MIPPVDRQLIAEAKALMGGIAFRDLPRSMTAPTDSPACATPTPTPEITPEEREQQARFLAALPSWVSHGQPQEVLLQAIGVPRTRLVAWLRDDPAFSRSYDEAWRTLLHHELIGIVVAMVRQAEAGDVHAARVCLELAGVLQQAKYRVDVTQMVTLESVLHDSRIIGARVVGDRALQAEARTPALAAALDERPINGIEHIEERKRGAS